MYLVLCLADFPTTTSEANTTTQEGSTSDAFTTSVEPTTASTDSTTEGMFPNSVMHVSNKNFLRPSFRRF